MLIGIPYSGKSTFVKNYFKDESYVLLSTDQYIETQAALLNKSYSEIFCITIEKATEDLYNNLHYALSNDLDIVWDQTNLSKKSRSKKLNLLKKNYTKIACFFETPDDECLLSRQSGRKDKIIPLDVIETMKISLEKPSYEEGFDEIYNVKIKYSLEKFV